MKNKIIIFGEVLFDCFPDGKVILGGAPFNVAWNLHAFGAPVQLISRIGQDELGQKVIETMHAWGMDISGLQEDPLHPTGAVNISFLDGEPSYAIPDHQAYDYIDDVSGLTLNSDHILYHGTLALRSDTSAHTLNTIKEKGDGLIFVDVNLRSPWWNIDTVYNHLEKSRWIKLNEQELEDLVVHGDSIDAKVKSLMSGLHLEGLILTRGAQGALLYTPSGEFLQVIPDIAQSVTDTVGAGDGFSSVILFGLLNGWEPSQSLQRAQEFACGVVGLQGATTQDSNFYLPFVKSWT